MPDLLNEQEMIEDFRVQFTAAVNDIRSFKEQQWKISHYALLLFAAIWGIAETKDHLSCNEKCFFVGLTIVLVFVSSIMLILLQRSLKHARKIANDMRKNFTEGFTKKLGEDEMRESTESFWYSSEIFFVMHFIIATAAGLEIWLVVNI